MKKLLSAAILGGTLAASFTANVGLAEQLKLETEESRLGYTLGVIMGHQLKSNVDDLDIEAYSQAIRDIYEGVEPQMSKEEAQATFQAFQQQKMLEQQAEFEKQAQANKEKGEAFLAENADKEGIQTTESGLQYKIVTAGEGAKPGLEDTVKVNYEGTLIGGEVFDSSYERGEPVSFKVNQVIQGWQEALQMMPAGSTWMLYIPAELAYGQGGTGGPIGPNETLIFKVELLEVTPAANESAEEAPASE